MNICKSNIKSPLNKTGGNSPMETNRVHLAYLTKQKHQI